MRMWNRAKSPVSVAISRAEDQKESAREAEQRFNANAIH